MNRELLRHWSMLARKAILRQTVCRVRGHVIVIDGGVYCARHLPWHQ